MVGKKDNSLLVEFDFIIDLDLAMFKMIQNKYGNSPYVDKNPISIRDEKEIVSMLLNRKHINPMEILMPEVDTTKLYFQFMDDENLYKELLSYAKAYDTFALMITFLKEASSVDITILCKNKLEENFIRSLNPALNTIIVPNKFDVPLNNYTALYLKYFVSATNYRNVAGKHIYIPAAKFNMEEDRDCISIQMVKLFSDTNIIHLIDLYRDVKYRFQRKEEDEDNGDLL